MDFHHRHNFCSTPNELAIDAIVYEFYASLKNNEIHKVPGDIHIYVTVQGKQVLVTPREIFLYYNTPYYAYDFLELVDLKVYRDKDIDTVLRYLTQGCGKWTHRTSSNILFKFNQAIMFRMVKMWMPFIFTLVSPT